MRSRSSKSAASAASCLANSAITFARLLSSILARYETACSPCFASIIALSISLASFAFWPSRVASASLNCCAPSVSAMRFRSWLNASRSAASCFSRSSSFPSCVMSDERKFSSSCCFRWIACNFCSSSRWCSAMVSAAVLGGWASFSAAAASDFAVSSADFLAAIACCSAVTVCAKVSRTSRTRSRLRRSVLCNQTRRPPNARTLATAIVARIVQMVFIDSLQPAQSGHAA